MYFIMYGDNAKAFSLFGIYKQNGEDILMRSLKCSGDNTESI